MLLDFSLEQMQPAEIFTARCTHTLNKIWIKANIYDDLYNSEDELAHSIINNLIKGLADMVVNRKEYEKLNPENGWGTYEVAIIFLTKIIDSCSKFPDATIKICKSYENNI